MERKRPHSRKSSSKLDPVTPPRSSKKYLVFISHSSKDRWIARQIAKLIESAGSIRTFLDERGIEGGDSILEHIRSSIQECDEFLVLLTTNSINRPWVLMEISAAWGQDKRIIAIIDKVAPEEMPEIILPYKAIDLNDFEDYIKQLKARVAGAKQ